MPDITRVIQNKDGVRAFDATGAMLLFVSQKAVDLHHGLVSFTANSITIRNGIELATYDASGHRVKLEVNIPAIFGDGPKVEPTEEQPAPFIQLRSPLSEGAQEHGDTSNPPPSAAGPAPAPAADPVTDVTADPAPATDPVTEDIATPPVPDDHNDTDPTPVTEPVTED